MLLGIRRAIALACLWCFWSLWVYAGLIEQRPIPADLPQKIDIKTPTESFTHEFEVALRDGVIWIKPLTTGRWLRLDIQRGTPPDGFTQISADGDNLIAIDARGAVYYSKLSQLKKWQMMWGLPFGERIFLPNHSRAVAISHRGGLAKQYEDIYGGVHPISGGVTTFYTLSENGRDIVYADPWLNRGFGWHIDGPERGQFVAVNLSASASTLFVVDSTGRMFTRLVDFDTIGDNWVLPYSYERDQFFLWRWQKRGLPGEDWTEQPRIPMGGRVTKKITIAQTGVGNASRELRIEGVDPTGRTGYYSKGIFDPDWTFVPTDQPLLSTEFLEQARSPDRAPSRDRHYIGIVRRGVAGPQPLEVELLNFNLRSSPATLRIWVNGAEYVDLQLHTRRLSMSKGGKKATLVGAIKIPEQHRTFLAKYVGKESVEIQVILQGGHMTIQNLTFIPRLWYPLDMALSPCRRQQACETCSS